MTFDLLIRGVDVLRVPGPAAAHLERQRDIAVRGAHIQAIEPAGRLSPDEARRVIEAPGRLALPGLINTHTHLAMVLFRGLAEDVTVERWFNEIIWPLESNLTPEDVYWGSLLGLTELIQSGVTAFADHYLHMDEVGRAVEEAGLRANLAWAFFESEDAEVELERSFSFAQRWDGAAGGRIHTSAGPHSPYTCSPELLRRAARLAHQAGLPVHLHVSETVEQVELSLARHGRTPIALLEEVGLLDGPALLAHAAHPRGEDLDILARTGAGVAHCPKTFLKLGAGIAPVAEMRGRGIPVGLGTDGAASNNTLDILESLRLAALAQKHESRDPERFSVAEALGACFHDGARVLGQPELGDLRPGAPADLCLMSRKGAHLLPGHDPLADLVYSARASDVETVLCAGRILMENRRLTTIDLERVRREVTHRVVRLLGQVPRGRIASYPH